MRNYKFNLDRVQSVGEVLSGAGALVLSTVALAKTVRGLRNPNVDSTSRLPRISAYTGSAAAVLLAARASVDAVNMIAPRQQPEAVQQPLAPGLQEVDGIMLEPTSEE